MCFVELEKAFDRVPRKVMDWAMRKKGIADLVRLEVYVHSGAKTRVRVDFELLDESEFKVEMHQGSVLSPFFLQLW